MIHQEWTNLSRGMLLFANRIYSEDQGWQTYTIISLYLFQRTFQFYCSLIRMLVFCTHSNFCKEKLYAQLYLHLLLCYDYSSRLWNTFPSIPSFLIFLYTSIHLFFRKLWVGLVKQLLENLECTLTTPLKRHCKQDTDLPRMITICS